MYILIDRFSLDSNISLHLIELQLSVCISLISHASTSCIDIQSAIVSDMNLISVMYVILIE